MGRGTFVNRWLLFVTFFLLSFFNSCDEVQEDFNKFIDPPVQCLAMPVSTLRLQFTSTSNLPAAIQVKVDGIEVINTCDDANPPFSYALNGKKLEISKWLDLGISLPAQVDVEATEWNSCADRSAAGTLLSQNDVPVLSAPFSMCGQTAFTAILSFDLP